MAGEERKRLDEAYHQSCSKDLQLLLAYSSDQMIGLNDKLGLPRPGMLLRGGEHIVRPLLRRL